MDFDDVVGRRRMVRDYDPAPVDPALVDRALAHATRAPSAGFTQGWAFVVLDTPADVRRFWTAGARDAGDVDAPGRWLRGMMRAPVVVVPCSSEQAYLDRYAESDKGWADRDAARWAMPYWHLDTAMASLLVLLSATDAGLGACFFGIDPVRVEAVRSALAIPTSHDPIGAITLGHPAARPSGAVGSTSRRARVPLEDVVHRGGWRS